MSLLQEKLAVPERAPGTKARQSLRHLKESVFGFEVLECDQAGQPTLIKRFGMKKETVWRRTGPRVDGVWWYQLEGEE